MSPILTVLMPVYNAESYLAEAIESLLNQSWTDFEFLIINDGSTDRSREIIQSFADARIRLVDNPTNIGVTKSLNLGLGLAQGEIIARQDADDKSYPERLSRQVEFLHAHPNLVLLGCSARAIDANGKPMNLVLRSPVGPLAIKWTLMFNTAFIHTTVMFRRSTIWEKMGGYNESFPRTQDFELWSRIAREYEVDNLPDVLVDRRHEYGSVVSYMPRQPAPIDEIINDNLKAFLQTSNIPADWAHHIIDIHRSERLIQRNDWDSVIEMYEQIYAQYCQLHPEAKEDKAIRSHFAGSLYDAAYCLAPYNRRTSFRVFMRAMKFGRRAERHPSFVKYAALWCFGDWIWHTYRRLYRNE
ncbi:MAG: glycosyltransferase [Deltaproteobacteria bacterium]|jgi:glycosyltransferase involved in cell wall biosynthesis